MKFSFVLATATSTTLLNNLINESSSFMLFPKSLRMPNLTLTKGYRSQTSIYESAAPNDNDGWFDDYDTFVSKLNFKDWDDEKSKLPNKEKGVVTGNRRPSRGDYVNIHPRGGKTNRGHDFTRSPDDDTSHMVDLEVIDKLLAERIACKRRSDFTSADKIRDKLLEDHGVVLWDKERIWTTNQDSRGGSARHRGNGRYATASRRGDSSKSRPQTRKVQHERNFGPTGHDYTQTGGPIDPTVCTLQEDQINEFLALRLKYKMSRNFYEADDIKDNLYKNGVSIHDGFKQWRADGEEWGNPEKQSRKREYTFRKRSGDPSLPQEQMDEIIGQVTLRADAKKAADFNLADSIKTYLAERYSVVVDDSHYEWSFMSDSYSLSLISDPLPEDNVLKTLIEDKVYDRAQAKVEKNYVVADAIRDELLQVFNVTIDDRMKEYTYRSPSVSGFVDTQGFLVKNINSNNVASQVSKEEEDLFKMNIQNPTEQTPTPVEQSGNTSDFACNSIDERANLTALTVPELKEKLREAGLPVSGRKDSLIERLLNTVS